MRTLLQLLAISALLALGSPSCIQKCKQPCSSGLPDKLKLLSCRFQQKKHTYNGITHSYFTPLADSGKRGRDKPPVLLLHEMTELSADVLKLAERLSRDGYHVYIPDLWDSWDREVPFNLAYKHVTFGDEFIQNDKALPSRKILSWLDDFCHRVILKEHAGQRIGCIGLCATGIFPVALSATVEEIYAPVASQPTLPIIALWPSPSQKDFAMSKLEIKKVQERIRKEPDFQIAVTRFEHDPACTARRMKAIKATFGQAVLDGTIPYSRYKKDGQKKRSHAVLTSCYIKGDPKAATHQVYREVVRFLDAKLKGSVPKRYEPKSDDIFE